MNLQEALPPHWLILKQPWQLGRDILLWSSSSDQFWISSDSRCRGSNWICRSLSVQRLRDICCKMEGRRWQSSSSCNHLRTFPYQLSKGHLHLPHFWVSSHEVWWSAHLTSDHWFQFSKSYMLPWDLTYQSSDFSVGLVEISLKVWALSFWIGVSMERTLSLPQYRKMSIPKMSCQAVLPLLVRSIFEDMH